LPPEILNLLFDQNISPKIIKKLSGLFPEAKQVRQLGLENATDISIFDYSRKHNFAIVTFDSDFVDLSMLKGSPPKIIWLRTGNLTTKSIIKLLRKNHQIINEFLSDDQTNEEILEIISD
jgi:predicted nuclease of predicted toxin-antitoxin system